MKKIIKNNLFGFILGAIIFTGVGVIAANTFNAKQIDFIPTNTEWKNEGITNVDGALNYLYSRNSSVDVIQKFFVVNTTNNLSSTKSYTASKKGTIVLSINIHTGIENVDSRSSYSVTKNNTTVTPTYINTGTNWNRVIYYIIDVEKDDVISYNASADKAGTAASLGIFEIFISN